MKDPNRERNDVLERLNTAAVLFEQSMDIRLIPAQGTKLGYAIRGARNSGGIAAVQGGIINKDGKPHVNGPCAFGVDDDICLLYTSPSPRDGLLSRMPSSA